MEGVLHQFEVLPRLARIDYAAGEIADGVLEAAYGVLVIAYGVLGIVYGNLLLGSVKGTADDFLYILQRIAA